MDVNYGMEIVRATEIAALNAARIQGLGETDNILNSTREAFYKTLNRLQINGLIKNDRFTNRRNTFQMFQEIGQGGKNMEMLKFAQGSFEGVSCRSLDKFLTGGIDVIACCRKR